MTRWPIPAILCALLVPASEASASPWKTRPEAPPIPDIPAGDTLRPSDRKPVLRHPSKVAAFLRPGTRPRVPDWARSQPFALRFRTVREGVREGQSPVQIGEAFDLPPGFRRARERLDSLLRREPGVAFTRPVLFDPEQKLEFVHSEKILVKWKRVPETKRAETWGRERGLSPVGRLEAGTWAFTMNDPTRDPVALADSLAQDPDVDWAEPEQLFEIRKHYLPDDPLFPGQQTLRNTGQNGGTLRADVRADSAWDITLGQNTITVAILDDGVQTNHPDLAANILAGGRNYSGVGSFGDPNPSHADDNHGTAVAGVTAALGNNGLGGSGLAPNVKILPVKISSGDSWASSAAIAQAIRWAADTVDADILSNSWGSTSSNAVRDAIRDASRFGRTPGTVGTAGRGSPVFFAAGNAGSQFAYYSTSLATLGLSGTSNRRIAFRYKRNGTSGENRMCLDNVGTATTTALVQETFSGNSLPTDWTTPSGSTAWASDSRHYSGAGDTRSICATPALGDSAEIRMPLAAYDPNQPIAFWLRRNTHSNDVFRLAVYNSSGTQVASGSIGGGVDAMTVTMSFPATADSAIGVGASSEFDHRVGYSQFDTAGTGKTVDFLAPSNGIWNGVTTTDRSGGNGYVDGDYTQGFGGTSAACPLAAGVAALILSRYPDYTRDEVLNLMRRTSDKVGGRPYDSTGTVYGFGWNKEYGYGRLNAYRALAFDDNPPVIAPRNDTSVNENQLLQFALSATDPDGDPVSFSVAGLPAEASVSGNLFSWTPSYADSGLYQALFIAHSGGKRDTDTVAIHVINVDRPPVFTSPAPVSLYETQTLTLPLLATDPDGDAIAYGRILPPAVGNLSGSTFSWTPGYEDSGSYFLPFTATANGLSDTDTVFVQVRNVDRPPALAFIPDTSVREGDTLRLSISATDPDGDSVAYAAAGILPGATFTGNLLRWTPGFEDSGTYSVRFYAFSPAGDSLVLADSQDVALRALNVDRPPFILPPGPQTVAEGDTLVFEVLAGDPDGDAVALSTLDVPAWGQFSGGVFTGMPGFSDSGNYALRVVATARGLSDTDTVSIRVTDAGTGLGAVLLVGMAGTEFLAAPAGPTQGAGLGTDSVLIPDLDPGVYRFAARAGDKRLSHFSVVVRRDSVSRKAVALRPAIALRFAAPETVLVQGQPFAMSDSAVPALGDLDGDGREDIVLFHPGGIRVLRNADSADRNQVFDTLPPRFPGLNPNLASAAFVDWDDDGFLDLLAASRDGDVFVVYGSDSGFFARQNLLARGGETLSVFAADQDGDGLPDLWVHSRQQGLFVHRNTGTADAPALDPSPVEVRTAGGAALAGPRAVWPLDLDGDGGPDLVSEEQGRLVFRPLRYQDGAWEVLDPRLVNAGGGTAACAGCRATAFIPESGLPRLLLAEPGHPLISRPSALLGDLNGDGRVDAADRDALIQLWESREGDGDWNASANLWVEGSPERIDVKDFAAMADGWGAEE